MTRTSCGRSPIRICGSPSGSAYLVTLDKKQVATSEVYTSGVFDQSLSGWFAGRLTEAGLGAG